MLITARLEEVYKQALEEVETISNVEDIDRLKTEIIETKQTLNVTCDRNSLADLQIVVEDD